MEEKVGYLGPEGTFSEVAVKRYCESRKATIVAYSSIAETILAVAEDVIREAVVPIENSLEGAVNTTLDLLAHDVELKIKREIIIPVNHCLLGTKSRPFSEIEIIYSHPQAIGQCMGFLRQQLPHAAIHFTNSTAEGAKLAAANPKAAAIGNCRAADLYELTIIQDGIQDREYNCTRFLVLGKEDHPPTGDDKTSLLIAVPDTPGSLYEMLGEFARRGINLQKIESRPSRNILGEYIFFIDVNGHSHDAALQEAIATVREKSFYVKHLGSYPCCRA